MSMRPQHRGLLLAVASTLLAAAGAIGASVGTAAANPSGACLLGIICPPSTTAPPPPSTTPATTAPPTTARTTVTTSATGQTTTTRTSSERQPSVGVSGLAPYGSVNLVPTGVGSDPVAPQLAGTPEAPETTTTLLTEALQPAIPNLTVPVSGPDNHRTLRIALGVIALLIAGAALTQLPGTRRRPRTFRGPKAGRTHVFPHPKLGR